MPQAAGGQAPQIDAQQTAQRWARTNGAAAPRRRGRPPNASRRRGGSQSRNNTPARNRQNQASVDESVRHEEEREREKKNKNDFQNVPLIQRAGEALFSLLFCWDIKLYNIFKFLNKPQQLPPEEEEYFETQVVNVAKADQERKIKLAIILPHELDQGRERKLKLANWN